MGVKSISKRVLFIRAKKDSDDSLHFHVGHLGLAMLSAILRKRGHEVLVVDYLLFSKGEEPPITKIIEQFKPDVIGLSLYTSTMKMSNSLIDEIRAVSNKPIIVGGPHATIFFNDLAKDDRLNYIIRGEAELSIVDVIEKAKINNKPLVVESPTPDLTKLPSPDFTTFLNYERIDQYPLLTSRGCPYGCSFCAVKFITARKWRKRDYKICVDEVEMAKKILPNLQSVKIVDDAPTTDLNNFKTFLKEYADRDLHLTLGIDNMRADKVDEELVMLAKKAGCNLLCLGVESGNSEVFKLINKGESLEDIKRAARLIKQGGLELGLCFIIGLPKDTYEKEKDSIALAKELRASLIFWNMAHPMEGTDINEWYKKNGAKIYDRSNYTSYTTSVLSCEEPMVETKDFSLEDRKKAHFRAVLETDQYLLISIDEFVYLITHTFKYQLYFIAFKSILRQPLRAFKMTKKFIKRYILRSE